VQLSGLLEARHSLNPGLYGWSTAAIALQALRKVFR
jgi:hypothetical protein